MYNLLDPLAPQGVFLYASVGVKFLIFRGSLNSACEVHRNSLIESASLGKSIVPRRHPRSAVPMKTYR